MNTPETSADARAGESGHAHSVEITVNFKPVVMPTRRATGLEIKKAAIDQGVGIQLDFVLFHDRGHGRRDRIRDDETIELTRGEKFEAVPGDDNS